MCVYVNIYIFIVHIYVNESFFNLQNRNCLHYRNLFKRAQINFYQFEDKPLFDHLMCRERKWVAFKHSKLYYHEKVIVG